MTRILAILLFLAAPAAAQVSASLSGTVTDQSGGLVSAAAVTVNGIVPPFDATSSSEAVVGSEAG